ncbi:MAG: S53 family peptidase [Terracoccus sp.]
MPAGVDGTGESIAIIELGGGFRPADLDHYFSALRISPSPTVIAVPVGGGTNRPTGNPTGPDGEVVLDIEVSGAIAPGAQIVVYFAPNTDQGFLAAVNAAIHDTTHESKVISIGWVGPESSWTPQAMQVMNTAFASANALGISVFAAAGDHGSTDGATDGENHADFPASASSAVACGGTNLQVSGTAITSETVWNAGGGATGGGVSDQFPVPGYQSALNPTSANPKGGHGRGVPDVAAVADPATGYQVFIDGQAMVFGGTSAVAPLWAGLITLVNQASRRSFSPLQSLLYPAPKAFNDITSGDNGAYSAAVGWDPCTGLGSPIGTAVLSALSGAAAPVTPPVAPTTPSSPPT